MSKPKLLDLFCGAGGASVGYVHAGFQVRGIDIFAQPRYPYDFSQGNALTDLRYLWHQADVIHASPPCQSYSILAKRNKNADAWPRLVELVRDLLVTTGKPYIIENVIGAPLHNPVLLCGTMFPELRVIRHRIFETNFPILKLGHGPHPLCHTFDKRKLHFGTTNEWTDFVQVTGGGNCSKAAARDAMQIPWMNRAELNEAIPPAYTHYIGLQLMRQL